MTTEQEKHEIRDKYGKIIIEAGDGIYFGFGKQEPRLYHLEEASKILLDIPSTLGTRTDLSALYNLMREGFRGEAAVLKGRGETARILRGAVYMRVYPDLSVDVIFRDQVVGHAKAEGQTKKHLVIQ